MELREYPPIIIISVKDGSGTAVDINNDSGFNNAYTYRGYRFDSESGLYFLQSRYYAAGIGRFLTKDSVLGNDANPKTLNRYAYAEGDPVNKVDPSGNGAELVGTLIGIGIGELILLGVGIGLAIYGLHEYFSSPGETVSPGDVVGVSDEDVVSDDKDFPVADGPPNGEVTLHNPTTGRTQRRYYDENGKAKKDIDLNHGGPKHDFPHAHDWKILEGLPKRLPERSLIPEEVEGVKDITHLIGSRIRKLPL